jgi:8-oxo-dGTP pyrophosphatase MutT (NUDIX family)
MRLRPRSEVLCFKGNKVLAGIADKGFVMFPGGGIDPNESAIEAAKREAYEEADRRVINCNAAHPPTVQKWPEDYAASNEGKWGKGFDGGITYWMTGSCGDHVHEDPKERHEDFEEEFKWMPVDEVMAKLKEELGDDTDWADDVKVRIKILETHKDMMRRHKVACAGRFARYLPDLVISSQSALEE